MAVLAASFLIALSLFAGVAVLAASGVSPEAIADRRRQARPQPSLQPEFRRWMLPLAGLLFLAGVAWLATI